MSKFSSHDIPHLQTKHTPSIILGQLILPHFVNPKINDRVSKTHKSMFAIAYGPTVNDRISHCAVSSLPIAATLRTCIPGVRTLASME